ESKWPSGQLLVGGAPRFAFQFIVPTAARCVSHESSPFFNTVAGGCSGSQPEDRNTRDVTVRNTTEVVRKANGRRTQLALACPSKQLKINLICHTQAGRADGVSEALQAPIDLTWDRAVAIISALLYIVRCAPHIGKTQILHQHQLGDREAIVHLDEVDLLKRLGD